MPGELATAPVTTFTIRCSVERSGAVIHYPPEHPGGIQIGIIIPRGGAFAAIRPDTLGGFTTHHRAAELAVLALLTTFYTPGARQ